MREAVIVSYARTGLAKSGRGGFNITPTVSMAAHAVKHAVAKAEPTADHVCMVVGCGPVGLAVIAANDLADAADKIVKAVRAAA